MGRKSVKENKNIYQQTREELGLTREAAAELLEFITDDRIEKIENEKMSPRPDEIMKMAQAYKKPELCNYYCSNECPIGIKYVPKVEFKNLSQITLEVLALLNKLEEEKNRFIEITVDGVISEDEKSDFEKIQQQLDDMSKTIDSLKLWVEKTVAAEDVK